MAMKDWFGVAPIKAEGTMTVGDSVTITTDVASITGSPSMWTTSTTSIPINTGTTTATGVYGGFTQEFISDLHIFLSKHNLKEEDALALLAANKVELAAIVERKLLEMDLT